MPSPPELGVFLLQQGLISPEQYQAAVQQEQLQPGVCLETILIEQNFISYQSLLEAKSTLLGRPYVILSQVQLEPAALRCVPSLLLRRHRILPFAISDDTLQVAMENPFDQAALDDLRMASTRSVNAFIAGAQEIDIALRQYLAFGIDPAWEQLISEWNGGLPNNRTPARDELGPAINIVDILLQQAVQGACSDIHLEPQAEGIRVRLRVDGELYTLINLPSHLQNAVISRVKILAAMDIAEKRIPQDGHFSQAIDGQLIDFRVSTLPTVNGEKAVLRILDRDSSLLNIDQLGLSPENRKNLLQLIRRPHGMLLVTGPTGSGKTTSLYAMLNEMNSLSRNIITLEDPVEYSLNGINQVQVNPKAGFNFAQGLRSLLRQDPDVMMVGEMRDHETARLGIQAALTGHLVLSTLHTNRAAGTIARLLDMGIEGFLLSSSLIGVLSQGLVRRLCTHCRRSSPLDPVEAERLGIPSESGQTFFHAVGCNMCRQLGYRGRIAVHELLILGPSIRQFCSQGWVSVENLEAAAQTEGMVSMFEDGLAKAKIGYTSLEEIIRIMNPE